MPSFTLPDHVTIDDETLQAIAQRHGLDGTSIERLPETGIINTILRFGETAISRVPRNHPAFIAHSYREAASVPAARAAGVRTPRLLAFDEGLSLLFLPRGAVPGRSRAERSLQMLLEIVRCFLDSPDERWRAVGSIEQSGQRQPGEMRGWPGGTQGRPGNVQRVALSGGAADV